MLFHLELPLCSCLKYVGTLNWQKKTIHANLTVDKFRLKLASRMTEPLSSV